MSWNISWVGNYINFLTRYITTIICSVIPHLKYLDNWKRAEADLINYKKRAQEEMEEVIETVMREAENFEEAEQVISAIMASQRSLGLGQDQGVEQAQDQDLELLVRFFEAKAKALRLSIEFPMRPARQGIKVGYEVWRPTDNVKKLDMKATIMRRGIAIPGLTTLKPRIMRFTVGYLEERRPIDLVVSIDTSGSTGFPRGIMEVRFPWAEHVNTADHEVIMFYALIELAKRINQRIGLTLWATNIHFTTLPKCLNWREMERLKREIITRWSGGFTRIKYALRQAKRHQDKLFFIITDGAVEHKELVEVDNVIFFLIDPEEGDYEAFVEKYGPERVIKVEDVRQLGKTVIKVWKALFWRG